MSESTVIAPDKPKRKYTRTARRERPDITIDGETWTPRIKLADEYLVSEVAIRCLGLATIYIAGIADNRRDELLQAFVHNRARQSTITGSE
jgi:hypothetical protein